LILLLIKKNHKDKEEVIASLNAEEGLENGFDWEKDID